MLAKGQVEYYRFSGTGAINGNLDNAAAVDRTSSYDPENFRDGVVDIPITGHKITAGPDMEHFTCIYLVGSTNYDGLRRIVSIPDANTVRIAAKFVAETFGAGAVSYQPGIMFKDAWEFLGFDLHLNTASATSENFTLNVDAIAGTTFDFNIFTQDFNTVKDYIKTYDSPSIKVAAEDAVLAAWANSDGRTWGLTMKGRRLS